MQLRERWGAERRQGSVEQVLTRTVQGIEDREGRGIHLVECGGQSSAQQL